MYLFYIKSQFVLRSKHFPPRLYETNELTMYTAKVGACSAIHTKHTNSLCGQNVEFVDVKPSGK
jgi:hypothetical protein